MSWLRGNFFFDVVVSVVTPQITSFPGKDQLDEKRNKNHQFSDKTKPEENLEKTQHTKRLQWSVRKDIQ